MRRARDLHSDCILLTWSETGTMSEYPSLFDEKTGDPLTNREFTKLVMEIFDEARSFCHVCVFIDKAVFMSQEKIESSTIDRSNFTLQRTNTGISVADRFQSVVNFRLPDSGRQHILVLYQGGDDDLYAVKLGLQLVRHDIVDLKIKKLGLKEEGSDDGHHIDFDTLKASITDDMKERVTIDETATAALEAVTAAVNDPSSAETVVITGRGSVNMSASVLSSSNRADSKVLGAFATAFLYAIQEKSLKTGLIAVQAKKENEELRRKTTNMSIEE